MKTKLTIDRFYSEPSSQKRISIFHKKFSRNTIIIMMCQIPLHNIDTFRHTKTDFLLIITQFLSCLLCKGKYSCSIFAGLIESSSKWNILTISGCLSYEQGPDNGVKWRFLKFYAQNFCPIFKMLV